MLRQNDRRSQAAMEEAGMQEARDYHASHKICESAGCSKPSTRVVRSRSGGRVKALCDACEKLPAGETRAASPPPYALLGSTVEENRAAAIANEPDQVAHLERTVRRG